MSHKFVNKIVSRDGNIVLSVVKNGKVSDSSCEVDGISGGTITSKGVDEMLKSCLKRYSAFLSSAAADATSGATKVENAAQDSAAAKMAAVDSTVCALKDSLVAKADSIVKEVKDELKK